MPNIQHITIQEAQFVDPRTDNDKFYRVFAFGSSWVAQYGRNGTIGVFTAIVEMTSPEAAEKAATAKFASKVKGGYKPVRSGVVAIGAPFIEDGDVTVLDELANELPLGVATPSVVKTVNPAHLDTRATDLTTLVATKLTKSAGSRPATDTDLNPKLPMRPMLASVQANEVVESALVDLAWAAQYKYDGDRVVIEVTNGEIRVLNRQGEEKTRNVGPAHLLPFTALHTGRWVFDGEVVGRTLVLFDIASASDGVSTWVTEKTQFQIRYQVLAIISAALGIFESTSAPDDAPVVIAPVAFKRVEKEQFLEIAIAEQREGIILRHLDGAYEPGRRSSTVIKHKLIKDADVIITDLHNTKQSATLSVHDEHGNLIEVGAASTIGKGLVSIGDVWVVTFLYVTDPSHPRLFQPRLVNSRADKTGSDCLISQFADAGTTKSV